MRHAALALLVAALPLLPAAQARQTMPAPDGEHVATVYFEWDSYAISPEAAAALDALVAKLKARPHRRIWVDGYSDRSIDRDAAMDLSNRMAWAVIDHLVVRGIDGALLTPVAHGWGGAQVETVEGVREPLNRRVAVTVAWK